MGEKQLSTNKKVFIAKCIALAILCAVEVYLGDKLLAHKFSEMIYYIMPPSESQIVHSPFDLPWETVSIVFFVLLGVLFLLLISVVWDWIRIRKARAGKSKTDPSPLPTSFFPKTIELYPPKKDITKTLEIDGMGQGIVLLQEIESIINSEIIT